MMMNGQHATFAAILGHGGFDELVVKEGVTVTSAASYYHSLHHRYFECNYGEMGMPFDHWFGTSHDGTPEARGEDAGEETAPCTAAKAKREKNTPTFCGRVRLTSTS